ncbi:MBL fold metallo-hydrolase RNA specificity domain-containing protein [Sphingomonas piscis]|uniref:MBL fold metallo-hydrolase RNA specificity domain-containing protein n=1 Tax=Sphingomonas piscis TaxID=2714943 RepID=UPI001FE92033|nr:MBL fold metallo-hydrolase [Sphingomonas piscis]
MTGSKHLLQSGKHRLLIDCGLFQGRKELRELNWQPLPIDPCSIDAVVLTHAHLDHTGYLPRLVKDGFSGPIFGTPASIDVAKLILLDSAFLQEKDAELANKFGYSRHAPAMPLYRRIDVENCFDLFRPLPMHKRAPLPGGADILFRPAGHILGAATAEIRTAGKAILFSGDLGRFDDPMMPDPEMVSRADIVIVESTYGSRLHEKVDAPTAILDIVERTVRRGGTVIVPAFAVGRVQSLLYYFWQLKKAGRLPLVPIYVDSPMATDATSLLFAHPRDHRLDEEACRDVCRVATYVPDVDGSKALSGNPMPKVIISASGMATGGRVLHHIKAFGTDPRSTILFSGYQAEGTRGRKMIEGERQVKIHGSWVDIRAEVTELSMLSAHADSDEIMRWLGGFEAPPERLLIVHGEPDSARALQGRVSKELNWKCDVVEMNQPVELGR